MKIPIHPGPASFFGAIVTRLLGMTWRIEWRGLERLERSRTLAKQGIFCFWHGRLLAFVYCHRGWDIQVLASEHADGDLIGRTAERLGFGHLKGSAVDGSRGPRGVVQQGAIELSRMTASAVIPVSYAARPRRLFASWDRFQLPGLFAKVVVAFGEPFVVPAGSEPEVRERYRLHLERLLGELTTELDSSLGYEGSDVWPHEGH
jgi:lysophospholipid acyltransferase (LPLAT)-like uncharacterized protein